MQVCGEDLGEERIYWAEKHLKNISRSFEPIETRKSVNPDQRSFYQSTHLFETARCDLCPK